jgi:hypothetical protein
LPITPSIGARISVKARSRSALAEAVRGACGGYAGTCLIAIGLRGLERLMAGKLLRGQCLLTRKLEIGAYGTGFRRGELGLRLVNTGLGRGNLTINACDRCLLARHFLVSGLRRQLVVAIVDGRDQVAGANMGVVGNLDGRQIARHLGGERRVVGVDIGVVGRHREAADRPPIVAVPSRTAEGDCEHGAQDQALAARRGLAVRWPRLDVDRGRQGRWDWSARDRGRRPLVRGLRHQVEMAIWF